MIVFIGRIDRDIGQLGDSKKVTEKQFAVGISLDQNGDVDKTGRALNSS